MHKKGLPVLSGCFAVLLSLQVASLICLHVAQFQVSIQHLEPCPLEEQTSIEYCFGGTHLVPQAELISVHCFQDMDNPCGALLIQGIL